MNAQSILHSLKEHFPDKVFELVVGLAEAPPRGEEGHVGDSYLVIQAADIADVCRFLKDKDDLDFDCLSDETAIDRKESFEIVYHLFSYGHKHEIVLKVSLPHDDKPKLPSVEGVWPVANWYEREIYDLFGIVFEGHSDLRRIMLPEDWVGYPLRKDYKEEADYRGISTTRENLLQ